MALRILGGEFRSRLLKAPSGQDTRPTRSLVRESVFNILQGTLEGAHALDLFAGSGAMGLEALSRGAGKVVFCEIRKDAARTIRENIDSLNVAGRAEVLQSGWEGALARLASGNRHFDIIFLDPPYQMDAGWVLSTLKDCPLVDEDTILVLEQSAKTSFSLPEPFETVKERQYGDTKITFIQKGSAAS